VDREGLLIENFVLAGNLTIVHAFDEFGFNCPAGRHKAAPRSSTGFGASHAASIRALFPSGIFDIFGVPFKFMIPLNFESSGSGRPLLALHGYGASLFSWRYLPLALPDRRVIRIDFPGHGRSPPRLDNRYRLADLAQAALEFIESQGLEDFDLVGHSMGGGVALMIAVDFMQRRRNSIRSLTLVDSLALAQRIPWLLRPAFSPHLGPFLTSLLPPRLIVRAMLRFAFYDRRRITEEMVRTYAKNLESEEGRHALLKTARRMVPDDLAGTIEKYIQLTLPALLIWGRRDRIVPPAIGIALNALIQGSTLILIDDCGHVPQEERPDVTLPAIAEFLSRVSPIAR
jgi:pimeloyl-ACP methyl ester carboxylesterase